jgi:DNA-binding Lrp family transcriptional regulator
VQDSVDETDLALINALQVTPRGSWTHLAGALDLDAATVARRWNRLSSTGLAWVTCGVGQNRHATFCMAYVEVDCRPGHFDAVQESLAARSEVVYLHHLTGQRGLLVVVARSTPALISDFLRETIAPMPGIRSYQAELRTAGFVEPSRWRLGSLDADQQRALDTGSDAEPHAHGARLDEVDQQIYLLLHENGRMPFITLAERAGISEPTARRRVNRLLSSGTLRLRCEIAQSISGWPISAVVWADSPAEQLSSAVRSLSAIPQVRLCCSLTGPRNLLLMVWVRTLDALPRLERTLCERAPGLAIVDRAICLRTVKQLGRVLDRDGRATANVRTTAEAFPVP